MLNKPQRIAIIDLGSNTCRLIIMSALPGYAYRLVDEIREVVRLQEGMTDAGLSAEAMTRGLSTLRLFKRFCDSTQVDLVIATATSAVRVAANRAQFVARVREQIGLELRVLSGEEEAYFGVIGALNDLPLSDGYVVDIGGGSAQVSQVSNRQVLHGNALPLGALRLTQLFVKSDPIDSAEIGALKTYINQQLDTFEWLKNPPSGSLIGLGGTIRNLATIGLARENERFGTLHGVELTRDSLTETIQLLQALPLAERAELAGLNSDRADIILSGALVLDAVMARLNAEKIGISVAGIRQGLFFEHFWGHLSYPVIPNVRRFSVLNLARIYEYQKSHANHVRFLAGRLFDELRELHGFDSAERELLSAAALLHDLGTVIGYAGHHRHSQTLIQYNGLPGFTPREIVLIGLLTRYHRKGNPTLGAHDKSLCSGDEQLLVILSALLRLAEYLERGRNAAVNDIIATWNAKTVRITLIADEYPAIELWDSERNALPLVALAFGRNIQLDTLATKPEWDEGEVAESDRS